MSTLRTAITTVKNFFVNLVDNQQEENPNEAGYQQHSSRFARSIFRSGITRKRPALSVYEPEITDDEDDSPSVSYFPACQNSSFKRMRVESDLELEMTSRKTCQSFSSRYCGSGSVRGDDSSRMKPSDRLNKADFQPLEAPGPSRGFGTTEKTVSAMKSTQSSDKNIEVITLDDDNPRPATCGNPYPRKHASGLLPPRRNELAITKPRVSTVMKSKPRDSNRFSRCLNDLNRKIEQNFHAIRNLEKNQYRQLLMRYNILNSAGIYETSALTKSKVSTPELVAMYSKFGRSPTKGSVTLCRDGKALAIEGQKFTSSADRLALVPVPRLFSTPREAEPFIPTHMKAIPYKKVEPEPEVVDLEKEPPSSSEIVSCISPITPVATSRNYASLSPANKSLVGNFTNLEDALNKSGLPDESATKDDVPETSALALETSEKGDEDISILAEKIVNKSRNRSINTLALEQTLCPYVDKRWLDEAKSSWRENQEHRKNRIHEETETLKILKRESTLDKDLEERIRKKLTLTEIIVLEEPPEELPELTDEILAIINHAKARGNDNEVLAQVRLPKDTISITRGDIRTLGPSQWLNDNVINTYMGLIVLRSKEGRYPTVYAFQTFFYPKLLKEGYSNSLKRWTRKDDIFAHDLIILPIHLGLHWCLACIDLRKKAIRYYDSLGGDNNKCLHILLDYISREMKERKQIDLDKSEWSLENVKGIPQQQNGSDCGMFSCKFAEYLSRDADFAFTQEDMPYYRDRMIYELIRSDLLHP